MMSVLRIMGIIILTPVLGGLLTGIDRVITARMQGRQGPPVLQPFYDVLKLTQKESIEVNSMHRFFVYVSMVFAVFTTVIMLSGGDILLAIFALTLGSVFFVLGGTRQILHITPSDRSGSSYRLWLMSQWCFLPALVFTTRKKASLSKT